MNATNAIKNNLSINVRLFCDVWWNVGHKKNWETKMANLDYNNITGASKLYVGP